MQNLLPSFPPADTAAPAGTSNDSPPEVLYALPPHLPASSQRVWRDRLSQLLESTGEGIFGIDLQGCCTFINRAGAQQLGLAPDDVLGLNMHELAHHTHADGAQCGAHYPERLCPIFNAFRQGLPCRIDTEHFWRTDGTPFAVEYSSYPIVEAGVVQGAVVTFVDISARRQAEAALRQAHAVLEQRVDERTQELSAALQQLRELSAYANTVREDERTRIAREVHDELGSLLVALKMDVNWMDKRLSELDLPMGALDRESPARQRQSNSLSPAFQLEPLHQAHAVHARLRSKCQNMSGLIERAVDNVGRIITDLRPSILDHQGLWAALEWQAHDFVQSAELVLDWGMQGTEGVTLPEPMAIAVFRIFQEMISNVGRHARASQLTLRILCNGTQLTITVQDNGCGADAQSFEAPTAYGVMGMRERALHFGGRLEISSQIGLGSLFSLHIPLLNL